MTNRKLAVIGQGYVGLPLAIRAAEVGFDVVGIDLDLDRIDALCKGRSYVEDVADERVRAALDAGRYHPTTDYAEAARFDVAVVSVPTPLRDGLPDLRSVESAGAALGPHLTPGCVVVLESTTYPGTTETLFRPILERESGLRAGRDFSLGYSPERIDPGNATWRLENTPKIVSGVDASSLAAVRAFFDAIVTTTVEVSDTRAAELAKLLENTFRHVNIALVNELAMFARVLGIDIWEVVDAAATKPFGFMPFRPGPGVGGHCLPIDPTYLSWQIKNQIGRPFRFVELANDINDHMPDHVVQRVIEVLNEQRRSVKGSRILLMGLAYKANSSDVRESPTVRISHLLDGLGASVRVTDPLVDMDLAHTSHLPAAELVPYTRAEIAAADLVVLLVAHDAFDLDLLENAVVLDTRDADFVSLVHAKL